MAFMINPSDTTGQGGNSSTGRPTLTPGVRTLWVCGVDFGTSQAGNIKISVRLICVDDGGDGSEVGAYCWDSFVLTPGAADRLSRFAKAVGEQEQFDAEDEAVVDEILRRCPVVAELHVEEFNGKTSVRPVRNTYDPHQGEVPEDWEALVQRGEEWHEGGKVKRTGAPVGTDADIPF